MPELPEVEVLVRHLRPLVVGRQISSVEVHRERVLAGTNPRTFAKKLKGAKFSDLTRRGKYLLFTLSRTRKKSSFILYGHLGMTGRMYLLPARAELPRHAAVVLGLGQHQFVFEDTRYFGRLTLDCTSAQGLGPEPLDDAFTAEVLATALSKSNQSIKIKLLDQSLVAGVGNIYASEALFRARISPRLAARRLKAPQVQRLRDSIRAVLTEAINCGSTVPLNYAGKGKQNRIFYFGTDSGNSRYYEERLRVYDQAGNPCPLCKTKIKRFVQAARSTFYCPSCQK